eukprot:m51a1_g10937 hypothetical protein (1481) ;mRNA; f:164640-170922
MAATLRATDAPAPAGDSSQAAPDLRSAQGLLTLPRGAELQPAGTSGGTAAPPDAQQAPSATETTAAASSASAASTGAGMTAGERARERARQRIAERRAREAEAEAGAASSRVPVKWLEDDYELITFIDAMKAKSERHPLCFVEIKKRRAVYLPPIHFVPTVMEERPEERPNQLDVGVVALQLHDHPLFGEEDMMASRLKEEDSVDKQILRRIAALWKEITGIREHQGFSCTRVKLALVQEARDIDLERAMMDRDAEMEVIQMEKDYQAKKEKNRKDIKDTHSIKGQQKANEGSSDSEDDYDGVLLEEEKTEGPTKKPEEKDVPKDKQPAEEKAPRSDELPPFDRFARLFESKYKQGVRRVLAKLSEKAQPAIDVRRMSEAEKARRHNIASTRFYVEVLVNNRHVCRTESQPVCYASRRVVEKDFIVHIEETFPLHLIRWPDAVTFIVHSETGVEDTPASPPDSSREKESKEGEEGEEGAGEDGENNKKETKKDKKDKKSKARDPAAQRPQVVDAVIAEIQMCAPALETSAEPRSYRFVSQTTWHPQWETADAAPHPISGTLKAVLQWGKDPDDGTLLAPPVPMNARKIAQPVSEEEQLEIASSHKLKEWLKQAADPNDPRAGGVLQLLGKSTGTTFTFTDRNMLTSYGETVRHKLYRKRAEMGLQARIPLLDGEPLDEPLQKLLEQEEAAAAAAAAEPQPGEETPAGDSGITMNPLADDYSTTLLNLLRSAQQEALDALTTKKRLKLWDVTTHIPKGSWSFPALATTLLEPYRPLKPTPRAKEAHSVAHLPEKVSLVVQVLHGKNIPLRAADPRPRDKKPAPANPEDELKGPAARADAAAAAPADKQQQTQIVNQTAAALAEADEQGAEQGAQVLPYVRLGISGRHARTRVSPGLAPTWNETLTLELPMPEAGGAGPADTLARVARLLEGELSVAVYDEVTVDILSPTGALVKQEIQPRFLGEQSFPLINLLFSNSRFEGPMKLRQPAAILSYSRKYHDMGIASVDPAGAEDVDLKTVVVAQKPPAEPAQPAPAGADAETAATASPTQQPAVNTAGMQPAPPASQIAIYAAIDPPLKPAGECDEQPTHQLCVRIDDKALSDHALAWCNALRARQPEGRRYCEPYCLTAQKRAVLLCQLLRPLDPPAGLARLAELLRFVSLIPPRDELLSLVLRGVHVVATAQQTLDMHRASALERAVLLACYVMRAVPDGETYVALGVAQAEGRVACVVVRDPKADATAYRVLNPLTGTAYPLHSPPPTCTLRDIDTVFSADNIWANLQAPGTPVKDLAMPPGRGWEPFFSPRMPMPERPDAAAAAATAAAASGQAAKAATSALACLQPESIAYGPPQAMWGRSVVRELEKRATEAFEGWRRPRFATHWNRVLGKALAELLAECEQALVDGKDAGERAEAALERWRGSHACVEGVAFGVALESAERVCEALEKTQVHLRTERQAEFALAVHVHQYVNHIAAVWVFVAALH